jgi:dTDP-4-dehydrorhamnose reductase
MNADILLFGCNGQVGRELQRSLAPLGRLIAPDHAECDLSDAEATVRTIREVNPRVIVNAAAYTAVDKAESDFDTAARINAEAPGLMAEEARRLGVQLIHYSTDYVFDGYKNAPYIEADAPAPRSVYGRTKRNGELAIEASGAAAVIFRTSWVFGAHGGNFAKTILRLAREKETLSVVADQVGSPTPAALIADVTAIVLNRRQWNGFPSGAQYFHLCAANPVSWHGFATAIVERARARGIAGLKLQPDAIAPIPTRDYPLPAVRPANSRLDCSKLEDCFDLSMPDWIPYLDRMLSSPGI